MRTLHGFEALSPPEAGSSITIGTFDGLHLGHRALIAAANGAGREQGWASTVVTWDRHPNVTLRPDRTPPLLTSPERKVELIEESGVDVLVILPFDERLSQWPPERFVDEVLVRGLAARSVFVGDGWRFGHRASGDVALLRELGERFGFSASGMALTNMEGEPVSSSRSRSAVQDGDVDLAARLLGRPFDIDGLVVRGEGRGRKLGYPTANLDTDPALVMPARGVYAGRARSGASWHLAAINVGVNPTFGGDPATQPSQIEAYLLDFDGDLYDQVLRVEFHHRLRDEQHFASVDDLVVQMGRDVEEARRLVG